MIVYPTQIHFDYYSSDQVGNNCFYGVIWHLFFFLRENYLILTEERLLQILVDIGSIYFSLNALNTSRMYGIIFPKNISYISLWWPSSPGAFSLFMHTTTSSFLTYSACLLIKTSWKVILVKTLFWLCGYSDLYRPWLCLEKHGLFQLLQQGCSPSSNLMELIVLFVCTFLILHTNSLPAFSPWS